MISAADLHAITRHAEKFVDPTDVVVARLKAHSRLLEKWQPAQNLVSRETLSQMWTRHFADSLQLLPLLRAEDRRLLDLGSGAGFPALPLAAASGAARHVTLLEPNQRKAAFLRAVIREIAVPASVEAQRVEQFDSRETIDVITSRAMAPLADLCRVSLRLVTPNTRLLVHKGREYIRELAEAAEHFDYDVLITTSEVDSQGVILELANLRRKAVST